MQGGFATAWGFGFAALGRLRPSRAEELRFAGEGTVLVIAAHPDDEAIGCGGTILRHRAAGDAVLVACVTDGRRSRALGLSPEIMAQTRKAEAEAAASRLRLTALEWLGLPEGGWQPLELAGRLHELLRRCRPTVIYAPSRVDFHPEHHAVAHALGQALARHDESDDRPLIRVFPAQVPLGLALVNRIADISPVASAHLGALEAYASQKGSLLCCLRWKRYAALAHRTGKLVEEFWQMTPAAYRELHRENPRRWLGSFRGFRHLAASDPAAYLVGRAARRRLVS